MLCITILQYNSLAKFIIITVICVSMFVMLALLHTVFIRIEARTSIFYK